MIGLWRGGVWKMPLLPVDLLGATQAGGELLGRPPFEQVIVDGHQRQHAPKAEHQAGQNLGVSEEIDFAEGDAVLGQPVTHPPGEITPRQAIEGYPGSP